ncbi:anti-sigma factor [Sphingomonas sp. LT1P40]|uniref:anti-sigma factor n=1 Tax=Alteristakelama amylovorans TaxID=3096166 RepID=UPI002FC683CB
MDDPVPAPGDRELLAAEHALGVLEGDALAMAQRRMLAEPGFAAEVEAWRERLAGIALEAADHEPPAAVWGRISAAIDGQGGAADNVATLRQLRRWRAGAIGAAALAAGLAGVLVMPQPAITPPAIQQPGPAVVAQLRGEGDGPVIAARYDPQTAELRLVSTDMGQNELAPELWIIPADGVPRSLGLMQPTGDTRMIVAQGHRTMMADGATLAVTMEPRDNAPHAAPSSAPVASGKIFGI